MGCLGVFCPFQVSRILQEACQGDEGPILITCFLSWSEGRMSKGGDCFVVCARSQEAARGLARTLGRREAQVRRGRVEARTNDPDSGLPRARVVQVTSQPPSVDFTLSPRDIAHPRLRRSGGQSRHVLWSPLYTQHKA